DLLECLFKRGVRLVLLGNVHIGSHHFHDLARGVKHGTTRAMDMLVGAVRQEKTKIGPRPSFFPYDLLAAGFKYVHVLGVNTATDLFVTYSAAGRVESKSAVSLLRQINEVAADIVRVTTRVAQSLRFCQISLASP